MIDVNLAQKITLLLKYPHTTLNTLIDPYIYKAKPSPFPRIINCFITEKCNFRCAFCHVDQSRQEKLTDLPIESIKKIIKSAAPYHPSFQLSGGEPLIHPDIIEIIKYIKKYNLVVGLVTNGFFLKDKAQELIDAKLDFLAVSLDGPDKKTQKKRGRVDSFNRILAGIEKFISLRGNKLFPNLRLATVITHDNLDNFDQILPLAEKLGVNQWSISHHFFYTNAIKKARDNFVKKYKMGRDIWGADIGNKKEFFSKKQRVLLKKKMKKLLKIKTSVRITYNDLDIDKYYTSIFPSQKSVCTSPYQQIFIRGDGDAEICQGYIIGNIKKQSLKNLWHNFKATHFRKIFSKCGLMPACFRCCALNIKFD